MAKPIRMILDVDTGIDDATAILYALRRPGIQLEAVTTVFGNIDVESATRNTLQVLELAGRPEIPVAMGAARSLAMPYAHKASFVHGENGLGEVELPAPSTRPVAESAADLIIRMVRENPGEITLVPTGTMTNVALAIMQAPDIVPLFREIVLMGGAVLHPGNVTALAEANIYKDPEAARILFRSGAKVKLVGLDVTMQTLLSAAMIEQIATEGDNAAQVIMQMNRYYLQAYKGFYPEIAGCALHDPLAVAVAEDPSLVTTQMMQLDVDCGHDAARGQTYADRRKVASIKPNVEVCLEVDADRFAKRFVEALSGREQRG